MNMFGTTPVDTGFTGFGGGAGVPDFGPEGGGVAPTTGGSDIFLGLPPGGSVSTPEGGVAPGNVFSIPKPGGGMMPDEPGGGGFNPAMLIKALPALAGGGMNLVNMFRSSPTEKLISSGQQQMRGISKAAGQAGKGQLNQYMQGRLSDPQQAAVERFKQQQRAYWNQYFAKAGIPVSSAMAEIEGKIEQDAQVYANQLLQQNFQNSMTSLGLANNSLAQQAGINWRLNTDVSNAQAAAAKAIAEMAGVFFPGGGGGGGWGSTPAGWPNVPGTIWG